MPTLAIIAVAFLGAIVLAAWERKKRIGATTGRVELTDQELYDQYFEIYEFDKDDVLELLNEVADTLGVPVGTLRPDDQFGKDVGGGHLITPELDTLSELALERGAKLGKSINLEGIKTIFDYVSTFARSGQRLR